MKTSFLIALIAAIVAMGIGYFAYSAYRQVNLAGSGLSVPNTSISKTPPPELGVPISLNYPGNNASEEEKNRWQGVVKSNARPSDTLTIVNCKGEPQIIKTKPNTILNINNQDNSALNIYMVDKIFTVGARNTTKIMLDFVKDGELVVYSCGVAGENGGILYISE